VIDKPQLRHTPGISSDSWPRRQACLTRPR
jgi:hypothetical protein